MRDVLTAIGVFVGLMVFVVGGATTLVGVTSHASYWSDIASVEQLRRDAAGVDPAQAENVIGQVTRWNQRIAAKKACNALWWCDFTEHDNWNTVRPIAVPGRK